MKIPVSEPTIAPDDIKAVKRCLESGWISSAGPAIQDFGQAFAQCFSVKHALPVATGTAALHLSLLAAGIQPGDEVIVPALTFVSPASMVAAVGAKPVFADVTKNSFVMNPQVVAKQITSKTKAIIAVHLYGFSVDLKPIMTLAKQHQLTLIEDCAEALGATYQQKPVGSFGDFACFSFFANKFITTGEGGMVVTNNKRFLAKAQLYCDHGMTKKRRYYHRVVGFNYRMTAMQAALGLSQLKRLPQFLRTRAQIEIAYHQKLQTIPQISWAKSVAQSEPVCWLATMLLPNQKTRNRLHAYLARKGIETRKVFDLIPGMPPYPSERSFPHARAVSGRGLSLPTSVNLTKTQINTVCRHIRAFFS